MSKRNKRSSDLIPYRSETFNNAIRQITGLTSEEAAKISGKVPYPKKERTEEEYNEKISLYEEVKKPGKKKR